MKFLISIQKVTLYNAIQRNCNIDIIKILLNNDKIDVNLLNIFFINIKYNFQMLF